MKKFTITIFSTTLAFGLALRARAQTFKSRSIRAAGSSDTQVAGINDSGQMIVNYADSAGLSHCELIEGSSITQIADPNEVGNSPGNGTGCYGINNAGQVMGSYSLAPFGNGFLYSAGTHTDILAAPSGGGSTAYGINNNGQIVGSYIANGGQHGFLYNGSTFEQLDVPGAAATLAVGINDSGEISLTRVHSSGVYSGAIMRTGVPNMTNLEAL